MRRILSLALLSGIVAPAPAQDSPTLGVSNGRLALSIPYIEAASGTGDAYSAQLFSTQLPAFSLDAGSLVTATRGKFTTAPSYSLSGSGLQLNIPGIRYDNGTMTQIWSAKLASSSSDLTQLTVTEATPGPAWNPTGGSCRPPSYGATAYSLFSGALKVELEDISQREGMQHVRFTNTSSSPLFLAIEVSSADGRVGLMAPQAGTLHLSPGETLIGYLLYYSTGVSGPASYRVTLNFTGLDLTSGRSNSTSDTLQATVSFVRAAEAAVQVSDASTQLLFARTSQETARVGFWRYKVDDAESRIVLFPGQENWTDASAAADGKIIAYTLDGKLLWTYSPGAEVWGGDASADGKYVAFATVASPGRSSSRLILLNAATGALINELQLAVSGLPAPANAIPPITAETDAREVRFSLDGSLLAVGTSEGRGYLFETLGLTPRHAVQTEGQLRAIEFHGDHLYLGSGDGLLYKLKLADGTQIWRAYTTAWPYSEPAFSPNGKWVVVGAKSGGFTVLETDTGACVFSANYGTVRRAYFTPDGAQVIAATGATSAGTIAYRTSDWSVAWQGAMSAAASTSSDSRYTLIADGKAWIMDRESGRRVATLDPGFSANATYFKTAYLSKDGQHAVVARRDLSPGDVAIAFFRRQ